MAWSHVEALELEVIALRAQCDALYGAKVVALEERNAQLVEALKAAEPFLYPAISRGPAVEGWDHAVALVEAALAAPEVH